MYEVKGRYDEHNVHLIIENASDFHDAVARAVEYGITEFYAVNLNSSLREVIRNDKAQNGTWYKGRITNVFVQGEGEKAKTKKVSYDMLFEADSLDDATALFTDQLAQGYDSIGRGIKEVDVFDVI